MIKINFTYFFFTFLNVTAGQLRTTYEGCDVSWLDSAGLGKLSAHLQPSVLTGCVGILIIFAASPSPTCKSPCSREIL